MAMVQAVADGVIDIISSFHTPADEESKHFNLLCDCLEAAGSHYGAMPAHAFMWQAAEDTAADLHGRLAVVPMVLEARGLDVTPDIQRKLRGYGDPAGAGILDIILRDEIGHVGLGDRWYRHLCTERGLEPESTYRDLLTRYQAPWPQGKMNEAARLAAGFSAGELAVLAKKR